MNIARRSRRTITCVATLGAAAALALTGCSSSGGSGGDGKTTFNIGTIADLSGPASVIGIAGENGQKIAVSLINSDPAKYLGDANRSLSLTYDDATNSVTTAVSQSRTFITQHALAIIGPTYQNQALSIGSILSNAKIPLIVPYSQGTPKVTAVGSYVFNTSQTNEGTIQAGVAAVQKYFPDDKKVGIITESDSSTQVAAAPELKTLFPQKGIQVVAAYSLPTASTDLASAIATMKSHGAQTVWIWNTAPAEVAAMQQADRIDYHPHWVGFSNMFDPSVISGGGSQAEGAIMTSDYNPGLNTPLVREFQTKYQAAYGKVPNSWAALGFQSVMTTAAAISSIHGKVTGAALRDALVAVKAASVTGSGTFEFDQKTRLEASPAAILMIKSGKFVTAS